MMDSLAASNSFLSVKSPDDVDMDEDHPVITLEDAMASLEGDGLLHSCDETGKYILYRL